VLAARPYGQKMNEVIGSLALRCDISRHPLLARRPVKRTLLVAITADKGLCGGYNANINRKALEILQGRNGNGGEPPLEVEMSVISVGRKGRDFLARRKFPLRAEHVGVYGRINYELARAIGDEVMGAFLGEEVDRVLLLFNEFRSLLIQRVTLRELLPMTPPSPPEIPDERGGKVEVDFLYEPDPEAILNSLLPRHIYVQVYWALLEAEASEFGARMTAMDNATENAEEMIRSLTLTLNRVRQASITKEIIEVVSGADSLKG
ncbi:MAG: ATP synthase F1 subunit gamma, partial [Nitrospinota bacterium]